VLLFRNEWVIAWSPANESFSTSLGKIMTNVNSSLNDLETNVTFQCKYTQNIKCNVCIEALVAAPREIVLEVSADKTKYIVMSRDQNAGRIHSVRIDNSTFERVEEFKCLRTTLTNQNSIAEEIKRRLRSGNACYHSMQNLLSSRLLPKNLKIKIYRVFHDFRA